MAEELGDDHEVGAGARERVRERVTERASSARGAAAAPSAVTRRCATSTPTSKPREDLADLGGAAPDTDRRTGPRRADGLFTASAGKP